MRQFRFLMVLGLLMGVGVSGSSGFELHRICQSNDTITLNFNPITDTCQEFVSYEVFLKRGPNQNFQSIETLPDASRQTYEHTPANIDNIEQWQYLIQATSDCNPFRVTSTDTMRVDKERPQMIGLDSVTVTNGKTQLGWSPHPDSTIKGYTIYYVDGGQTRRVDQVLGHKNTTYTDEAISDPTSQSEKWRIGVFDSCNNESPVSSGTHSSIFLQKPEVDTCTRAISLDWSGYQGWDVGRYAIVATREDREPEVVKKVDGSAENPTATTVDTLSGGSDYELRVRAVKAGDETVTSTSNRRSVKLGSAGALGYVYLESVSVVDSLNQINLEVEQSGALESLTLLKGGEPGELTPFQSIEPVEQTAYTLRDSNTNPQESITYYQIRANGLCQDNTVSSNLGRNIFLELRSSEDSLRFNWQRYEVFNSGVEKYQIQRQTRAGDVENWETIGTVGPEQLTYSKLNEFDDADKRKACFRVKATEGPNNQFGFKGESTSNVVCLFSGPQVYVPNAIVVGGVNGSFKPGGRFINMEASSMSIYNRWGEEVYSTNSIAEGWDGTYEGEPVQQGQYFYKLTIVGVDQSTSTESGSLTVIR